LTHHDVIFLRCHGDRELAEGRGWQRRVKRGIHTLKRDQYEVIVVDGPDRY
jgi:hypothetical protein